MTKSLITIVAALGLSLGAPAILRAAGTDPFARRVPGKALMYVGWTGRVATARYRRSRFAHILRATGLDKVLSRWMADKMASGASTTNEKISGRELAALARLALRHKGAWYFNMLSTNHRHSPGGIVLFINAGADAAKIKRLAVRLATEYSREKTWKHHPVVRTATIGPTLIVAMTQPGLLRPRANVRHTALRKVHGGANVITKVFHKGVKSKSFVQAVWHVRRPLSDGLEFRRAQSQIQPHPIIFGYLNVKRFRTGLVKSAKPTSPSDQQMVTFIKKSGIHAWKCFAMGLGFSGKDVRYDMYVDKPTPPLAAAAVPGAAMASLLSLAPASTAGLDTFTVHLRQLQSAMLGSVKKHGHGSSSRYKKKMARLGLMLGLNIDNDLLAPMSGHWIMYAARTPARKLKSTIWIHPVRQPMIVRNNFDRLTTFINMALRGNGMPPAFAPATVGNLTYQSMPLFVGFAPTWAVHHKRFYFGFDPRVVVLAATNGFGKPGMSANRSFVAMRKRLKAPAGANIAYTNTRVMGRSFLSTVQNHVLPRLAAQGAIGRAPPRIPFNKVTKYLTSAMSAHWSDQRGWHERGIGPFPGAALLDIRLNPNAVAMMAGLMGSRMKAGNAAAHPNAPG